MRRGEVWWSSQPSPVGHRPVILLSRNESYSVRTYVAVANVTTRIRNIPVEVSLGTEEGLPKPCVVNIDTLATIPKKYLEKKMGSLSPMKIQTLNRAIAYALGLNE